MANKKATKNVPLEGIVFPLTEKNDRSSSVAGREVYKTVIASVSPTDAEAVNKIPNWRFGYTEAVVKQVELSARSSEDALKMAETGLNYMYEKFEFIRDGETVSLEEAMTKYTGTYETGVVKGKHDMMEKKELQVPYKGRMLKGKELADTIDAWATYGTIEPSCADALKACVLHPEWMDLSDRYFVLLGAGSAMGPFNMLTALGANIIALDLDRPHIWKRLIEAVENSTATITFPLKKPQSELSREELYENAGCNLLTNTPEIKNWVAGLYPDKVLNVGCYAYLDGELHVRVSLAMDMVVRGALAQRKNAAVAYLNTPSHAYVVPDDARKASLETYSEVNLFNIIMSPFSLMGGSRALVKNYAEKPVQGTDGKERYVVDGLVVAQGPNYALAKSLQQWRAILARAAGHVVSSNVAPSTATLSVVHNRTFAWAYDGMYYFKPMEIFQQDTSNAVMAALLIYDVANEKSIANPQTPTTNPWDLFSYNAFHGGVWRSAYKMTSVGEMAAALHFFDKAKPALLLAVVIAVVAAYWGRM